MSAFFIPANPAEWKEREDCLAGAVHATEKAAHVRGGCNDCHTYQLDGEAEIRQHFRAPPGPEVYPPDQPDQ